MKSRMHQIESLQGCPSRSSVLRRSLAAIVLSLCVASSMTNVAWADDHDSTMAGHPLRIVAYVVHPVGVVLDYLIFRPAHWIASHEPIKTLVGHED